MSKDEIPPEMIDVRVLMRTYSVEKLNAWAEEYFARLPNWDYLLAKPFGVIAEAPTMLLHVAKLLQGLDLLPDHRVLDFGAGSCWLSRWLTQLGCQVHSLDVSQTALAMGARLFEIHPPIGTRHPPQFIHFDGHRLPFEDDSVDRIVCYDAFHHLVNPTAMLAEMARVLSPGGIAGFSEPGPHHSRSPRSQSDMKLFRTIENDIVIEEIAREAEAVGFTSTEIEIFDAGPHRVSPERFKRFLAGHNDAGPDITGSARTFMADHHTFFLRKGPPAPLDSRSFSGLRAELSVRASTGRWMKAHIVNTGTAFWLPMSDRVGAVNLGCHLLAPGGQCIDYEFYRVNITPGRNTPVPPGEHVEVEFEIPAPPPGDYILEFDLVSASVCWFVDTGSATARVPLHVA